MNDFKKTGCGSPFFVAGCGSPMISRSLLFWARCGSPFDFFAAGVAHLFKTYK